MSSVNYQMHFKVPENEQETVRDVLEPHLHCEPIFTKPLPTKTPGVFGITFCRTLYRFQDLSWVSFSFEHKAYTILTNPKLNLVPVQLLITSDVPGISHSRYRQFFGSAAQITGNVLLADQQRAFDAEEEFWPEQLAAYRKAKMKRLLLAS